MKKIITVAAACAAVFLTSCKTEMNNPLLTESAYRYEAPVFDKITEDHYVPAFEAAIAEGKKEIDAIVNNPAETTWHNIVAWSRKGMPDFEAIRKGTFLALEGKIRYVKYTNATGEEKNLTEIVAQKIIIPLVE